MSLESTADCRFFGPAPSSFSSVSRILQSAVAFFLFFVRRCLSKMTLVSTLMFAPPLRHSKCVIKMSPPPPSPSRNMSNDSHRVPFPFFFGRLPHPASHFSKRRYPLSSLCGPQVLTFRPFISPLFTFCCTKTSLVSFLPYANNS